jgi:peptidyl-prolyl cis-trans isomerase SurA
VIERVVAVVDQHPILLSEVHRRAHLAYARARDSGYPVKDSLPPNVLAGAVHTIVDEVLLRREADERQLSVSDEEVSKALESVAASNGLSVEQVYAEALKAGLDRAAYREEMIRTLLEYKLLQLILLPKVHVEDREVREAYARKLVDTRARYPYRPAWVLLRIPKDAGPEQVAKLRTKAETVTKQARAGADFATLARRYSDDESTKGRGGDLGLRVPQGQGGMTLRPELHREAAMLGKGETSDPVRIDDAFVVLHLLDRSAPPAPSFESSQETVRAQLLDEKVSHERRTWLRTLRQKYPVELRFVPIRGEVRGP